MTPEQSAAPLKKSPFSASSGATNPFGDSDALWRNTEAEWMPEDDLKWYQSFSKDQVVGSPVFQPDCRSSTLEKLVNWGATCHMLEMGRYLCTSMKANRMPRRCACMHLNHDS